MHKHKLVKVAFVTLALVMGAGVLKSSTLEANGYVVLMGINGEITCEPGGLANC